MLEQTLQQMLMSCLSHPLTIVVFIYKMLEMLELTHEFSPHFAPICVYRVSGPGARPSPTTQSLATVRLRLFPQLLT